MAIEFNLDTILQEKQLNISEASRLCEIRYPTMYAIAKNKQVRVDLLTLSKLSTGLQVSVGDLFREKSRPTC